MSRFLLVMHWLLAGALAASGFGLLILALANVKEIGAGNTTMAIVCAAMLIAAGSFMGWYTKKNG